MQLFLCTNKGEEKNILRLTFDCENRAEEDSMAEAYVKAEIAARAASAAEERRKDARNRKIRTICFRFSLAATKKAIRKHNAFRFSAPLHYFASPHSDFGFAVAPCSLPGTERKRIKITLPEIRTHNDSNHVSNKENQNAKWGDVLIMRVPAAHYT